MLATGLGVGDDQDPCFYEIYKYFWEETHNKQINQEVYHSRQ